MKVKVEDVEDSKPLILNQNDNGLKRRRRSFNEDAGSPPPKRQYLGDTSESIVPKAEKPGVQVRNKTLPPPIAPPKPKSAAQKKKTGPKSQKKTPQKNRVWLGIKRQDPVMPNKASNERLNAVFAAAAKNAIKVDGLDYAAMAKVRDKAMPGSRTFSNTEESFPLSKALPNYLPPQAPGLVTLDWPDGGIIEDMNGVPLFVKFCGTQSDELQSEVIEAGAAFSKQYRRLTRTKGQDYYADIPNSPFKAGKCYYAKRFQPGHFEKGPSAPAELLLPGQIECWEGFFESTGPAFDIINVVVEQLDFKLAQQMRVLRNAISARKNEHGDLLSKGPSHFPAIGLHFNSKPLRPGDALPAKSNNVDDDGEEVEPVQVKMVPPSQDGRRHENRYFQGLDVIAAYGDYDDAYVEIPHQETSCGSVPKAWLSEHHERHEHI